MQLMSFLVRIHHIKCLDTIIYMSYIMTSKTVTEFT